MASNFNIHHNLKNDNLYIELKGDFDGSSAMQLLHYLGNSLSGVKKIYINTDRFGHIGSFGRRIFRNNLPIRKGISLNIIFKGEKPEKQETAGGG